MIDIGLAILLTLLAAMGWILNVLGMPGNWLVVLLGGLCFWFRTEEQATHIALATLLVMLLAAVIGELLEFAAGALGASRRGATKRGTALAICGSIAGAIAGLFVGTPIPIIGSLVASLLLGAAGAFSGAVLGERWAGKEWDASVEIGNAAFWGRLLGTVGKAVCGTIVAMVFFAAIWF